MIDELVGWLVEELLLVIRLFGSKVEMVSSNQAINEIK